MSTTPDLEIPVLETLELAVAGKARVAPARACGATLPSMPAQGTECPSRLPPPKPARPSNADSGRYSYVAPRPHGHER